MVLDVVGRFKAVWSVKAGVQIDDAYDQLNRTFMFFLLVILGFIVTSNSYIGEPLSCTGFKEFGTDFVEDYCWTQGLYTILEAYGYHRDRVPYPGIIPEDVPPCQEVELRSGGRITCPPDDMIKPKQRIYHLWYQWVPFYFWVTAISFYTPFLLSKMMGFADLKPLINMMHNPIESEQELTNMAHRAATWIYYHFAIPVHKRPTVGSRIVRRTCCFGFCVVSHRNKLALVLLITKLSYLVVSSSVFYLTSRMFSLGNFLTYGVDWAEAAVWSGEEEKGELFRDRLFPKMAACEIRRWGATGMMEENGMCVLAPNVVNQYLFLIVWTSLVLITISNLLSFLANLFKLSYVHMGYRRFVKKSMISNTFEAKRMYWAAGRSARVVLHILASHVRSKVMEDICSELDKRLQQCHRHHSSTMKKQMSNGEVRTSMLMTESAEQSGEVETKVDGDDVFDVTLTGEGRQRHPSGVSDTIHEFPSESDGGGTMDEQMLYRKAMAYIPNQAASTRSMATNAFKKYGRTGHMSVKSNASRSAAAAASKKAMGRMLTRGRMR